MNDPKINSVLMLLPGLPFPSTNGGKRAHYANMLEVKTRTSRLMVIVANTDSADIIADEFCNRHPDISIKVGNVKTSERTKTKLVFYYRKIRSLVSFFPQIYADLHNSSLSLITRTEIQNNRFDAIWVDQISAMAMLPKNVSLPIILSTQNVESDLLGDIYKATAPFTVRRFKRWLDWKKCLKLEKSALIQANHIICISNHDASILRTRWGINIAHIMLPKLAEPTMRWQSANRKSLLFVGQTTHLPNKDAIDWIVNQLAPQLYKLDPTIQIDIVGSTGIEYRDISSPSPLTYHGRLADEDLKKMLLGCTATICPVILGSGIKIKILEAASNGVPVIATTESLRGLELLSHCIMIDRRNTLSAADIIHTALNSPDQLAVAALANVSSLTAQYSADDAALDYFFASIAAKAS